MQNAQPGGRFEVVLANGEKGTWYTSEKMRKFRVAIGTGDRVSVRFAPEAPDRGRIVYRYLPSLIED